MTGRELHHSTSACIFPPRHQNVPLLSAFLSPAGMIKPRRLSGLCAKCQRKVAKTIKRARHIGVIPHTMGIEVGCVISNLC